MQVDGKEVVFVKDVIAIIQDKLQQAHRATAKVLPGRRGKIYVPLQEASTLLKSVEEVMERSGMDKRLGFVKTPQGVQPVVGPAPVRGQTKDAIYFDDAQEAADGA